MGRARAYGYGWNPGAARYIDLTTGRFVSETFIEQTIEGRIDEGFERLQNMLAAVLDGGVPVETWQEAFAVELRRGHTQMMALGKGGWSRVTPSDWGKVGAKLKKEYGYLRDFAQAVADGRVSIGQIMDRMNQYASGVWSSYWKGDTAAKQDAGFDEEMRVLNSAAKHCSGCPELAGHWEPIGTLPAPGEGAPCRHKCRCGKRYRKSA